MKPVVVVVGSLNMDFVATTGRLPRAGETVLGRDFRMMPGGKGANQAVAAARLGSGSVAVKMIGCVGLDLFGDRLRAGLSSAGVDVSGLHASRSQPTGIAMITVDSAGCNQIVVAPGANAELRLEDVEAMRRVFTGARLAMFQLETPAATVAAALRIAREEGLRTILDPAPAGGLAPYVLSEVDILTPNESEACVLLGREPHPIAVGDAAGVAKEIAGLGARMIVLKLGEQGCFFYGAGEAFHVPGFKVQAVDTTAAGDTFNSALAVALCEGSPMRHALRFANAAAAVSVTRHGAQASLPTRAEVDRFQLGGESDRGEHLPYADKKRS